LVIYGARPQLVASSGHTDLGGRPSKNPVPASVHEELPHGWNRMKDEHGNQYFFNTSDDGWPWHPSHDLAAEVRFCHDLGWDIFDEAHVARMSLCQMEALDRLPKYSELNAASSTN
jgi:hypothetical protein